MPTFVGRSVRPSVEKISKSMFGVVISNGNIFLYRLTPRSIPVINGNNMLRQKI